MFFSGIKSSFVRAADSLKGSIPYYAFFFFVEENDSPFGSSHFFSAGTSKRIVEATFGCRVHPQGWRPSRFLTAPVAGYRFSFPNISRNGFAKILHLPSSRRRGRPFQYNINDLFFRVEGGFSRL